jgi:hypothetical protein
LVQQAHQRVVRPAGQPGIDCGAQLFARSLDRRKQGVALIAEPFDASGVGLDEQRVEVLVVVEDRPAGQAGLRGDVGQ